MAYYTTFSFNYNLKRSFAFIVHLAYEILILNRYEVLSLISVSTIRVIIKFNYFIRQLRLLRT